MIIAFNVHVKYDETGNRDEIKNAINPVKHIIKKYLKYLVKYFDNLFLKIYLYIKYGSTHQNTKSFDIDVAKNTPGNPIRFAKIIDSVIFITTSKIGVYFDFTKSPVVFLYAYTGYCNPSI